MSAKRKAAKKTDSTAHLGFEAKLWLAADKLRNNMDAAEYKHVVLGLIFVKYISDTFEEHREKLLAGEGDYAGANPEDPDEYKAADAKRGFRDRRKQTLFIDSRKSRTLTTLRDTLLPKALSGELNIQNCEIEL